MKKSVKIFSGMFAGKKIFTPEGLETRPTAAKIRESLFNILLHNRFLSEDDFFSLTGKHVLDVFAGSGALGLEALSRGAESVTFCDQSFSALKALKQNVADLNIQDRAFILSRDMRNPGTAPDNVKAPFHLIFTDPPYHTNDIETSIRELVKNGWIAKQNLFVTEHAADQELALPENFTRLKDRIFGKTKIAFYSADL